VRRLLLLALALAGCGEASQAAPATPTGTLYLAGRDPGSATIVDAGSGRVTERHLRQLGGGDPPYFVYATGGRVVTFALNRATSFDPALKHPRSLGEAWYWVPSATPGRIWTIQLERHRYAFRSTREVTVTGQVTVRGKGPPGWVAGATTDGLLIQKDGLFVWNPRTGARTHVPGFSMLAIRGDLIATCSVTCPAVHLGTAIVRGNFSESGGEFSPDGAELAVPTRDGRISVVDVAARTSHVLAGARVDRDYPSLTWASTGWLFYNAGGGRIGAWRPGVPARLLDVHVGKSVRMVAA
jgi:hypothetical protein